MSSSERLFQALLESAAVLQIIVAVLNLNLVRLLGWRSDLARLPLLLREVFHVHSWFVSIVLTIFGVLTLRFAGDMASDSTALLTWLTGAIAIFWGFRTVLQVAYYSSSHWRGRRLQTAAHAGCLFFYGSFTTLYAVACLKGA